MRFSAIALSSALLITQALGQSSSLASTIMDLRSALDRGHGQMCGLDYTPAPGAGYYPCVDIGPYRFVAEYGRTRAFVVMSGQAPFHILVADGEGARFQYQGPWMNNLEGMVAGWLVNIASPASAAPPSQGDPVAAGSAVEAYLKAQEPQEEVVAAPPATPAGPQVIYIMPPNYQPGGATVTVPAAPPAGQIPLSGTPSMQISPGGVVLAPGVVGYPNGLAQ